MTGNGASRSAGQAAGKAAGGAAGGAPEPVEEQVVVVGGGIGGLATAVALALAGRRVRVLERAATFAEIGAGIQLAPNATRLLQQWGLLDRLVTVGTAPRRLLLADALTGRELIELDLTAPFLARYGAPYLVAHRGDLLHLLLDRCRELGVELQPGSEVTGLAQDAAGVTVECAGGGRHRARLVIAADGLHSRFRALLSDDRPVCRGYVAYRGAIPTAQARRTAGLDEVVVFIGPGMHFVQYALRGGDYYNQVAVFRSDRYGTGDPDWGSPAELRDRFDRACPHVRIAAESLRIDQRWPMADREPITGWVAGDRIALLGDAAHPMLQYLAQGACQALEDAAALAAALADPPVDLASGPEVRRALHAYQAARAPRTARVQRNARAWGEIWHLDGIAAGLRNEAFARRGPTDYRGTDWLYGATGEQRATSPALPPRFEEAR